VKMSKTVAWTDDFGQRGCVVEGLYRLIRCVAAEAYNRVDLARRALLLVHRADVFGAWPMAGLAPNVGKGNRCGVQILRPSRTQEAGHVAAKACGIRGAPRVAQRRKCMGVIGRHPLLDLTLMAERASVGARVRPAFEDPAGRPWRACRWMRKNRRRIDASKKRHSDLFGYARGTQHVVLQSAPAAHVAHVKSSDVRAAVTRIKDASACPLGGHVVLTILSVAEDDDIHTPGTLCDRTRAPRTGSHVQTSDHKLRTLGVGKLRLRVRP
jgi:hypothetical protein